MSGVFVDKRAKYEASVKALNELFIIDGKVDVEYMIDQVRIYIINIESIYKKIYTSSSTQGIIWQALLYIVDEKIKDIYYPVDNYYCNSDHLKKWFKLNNLNYKEVFKDLVNELTSKRKVMILDGRKQRRKNRA